LLDEPAQQYQCYQVPAIRREKGQDKLIIEIQKLLLFSWGKQILAASVAGV
jgi:hypothetical protein